MNTQILEGYSSREKTAYITAIASIATADNSANDDELIYLENISDAAGLNDAEKQKVFTGAEETSGESIRNSLEVLKTSELKYSLIAELIAFAQADREIGEEEKEQIRTIAHSLNINDEQVDALSEFVEEKADQQVEALGVQGNQFGGGIDGLLSNLGLNQKLQNSGINVQSLVKGLISIAGPLLLGKMLNKNMHGRNSSGFGAGMPGGLGSLIGSLSGGKSFSGMGGFLSGLLK